MNVLDWAIIGFLVLGLFRGWRRGFVSLAVGIAGYIVAYTVAARYYAPVAADAQTHFFSHPASGAAALLDSPVILDALAFVAIILAVLLVVSVIAGIVTARRIDVPVVGGFNRLMGALLGVGENLLLASFVLFVLSPFIGSTQTFLGHTFQASQLYQHLMQKWAPPFTLP